MDVRNISKKHIGDFSVVVYVVGVSSPLLVLLLSSSLLYAPTLLVTVPHSRIFLLPYVVRRTFIMITRS